MIYYGDSVADTVPGHMQEALTEDPDAPAFDVINAGIRGYTNYQELLYLKKYGFAFRPDVIGVEFCLNDLHQFLHSFDVQERETCPWDVSILFDGRWRSGPLALPSRRQERPGAVVGGTPELGLPGNRHGPRRGFPLVQGRCWFGVARRIVGID